MLAVLEVACRVASVRHNEHDEDVQDRTCVPATSLHLSSNEPPTPDYTKIDGRRDLSRMHGDGQFAWHKTAYQTVASRTVSLHERDGENHPILPRLAVLDIT